MGDVAGGLIGQFLVGLVVGLALVIVLALFPSRPGDPPRSRGLFLAAVAVGAIATSVPVPMLVVAGILTMALGGTRMMGGSAGRVLVVPGAVMLVAGADADIASPWPIVVVCLTVAATVLVGAFDDGHGAGGYSFPLFAVSSLGLFLVVPDTDAAVVLFGVALPALFVGWPSPIARLGRPGAYATTGVFMWVALIGGQARPETILVATACLGFLLTEPLLRPFGSLRIFSARRATGAVVAAQTATVLVLIELPERFGPWWSTAIVVSTLIAATLIVAVVGRRLPAPTPTTS